MMVYYDELNDRIYLVMRLFGPYGNYEARSYECNESFSKYYISITMLSIPPSFYLLGEL